MKTAVTKPSDIRRSWYIVDAEGKTLGRLASTVARVLTGKHKPIYTPALDCGDYVIVVNAAKIRVTGNKLDEKFYTRHSMYPGGFRKVLLREVMAKNPQFAIRAAVGKMLPKNRLRAKMLRKLKIYAASEHPHAAHKPQPMEMAK